MNISIAVTTTTSELEQAANVLAERLHLPYISDNLANYTYLLILTPSHLGLQKVNSPANPLIIDFLSKKMAYRRQHATLRNEIIARALGLKNKLPRHIIDATAGLCRDSFILATLGFEINIIERSPIIFALIEDAIARARKDTKTQAIIERLHPIQANANDWLKNQTADVIYLDPMFPERKKSALSKQDMRIFHDVVGDDGDADELLTIALTCAKQRVVVKRPRLAAPLCGLIPSFSMEGSSNRFDIYLT
jgi:16S rRNA (guanine1516-N2)-methyltransferase